MSFYIACIMPGVYMYTRERIRNTKSRKLDYHQHIKSKTKRSERVINGIKTMYLVAKLAFHYNKLYYLIHLIHIKVVSK